MRVLECTGQPGSGNSTLNRAVSPDTRKLLVFVRICRRRLWRDRVGRDTAERRLLPEANQTSGLEAPAESPSRTTDSRRRVTQTGDGAVGRREQFEMSRAALSDRSEDQIA